MSNPKNTAANNNVNPIVIAEPNAKATNAQLRVIGHAVKEEKLPRFAEEAWKALTKGEAAVIITKL